jgi:hypothetical protein
VVVVWMLQSLLYIYKDSKDDTHFQVVQAVLKLL